ncbi:MAG: hypothetical protein KIS85_05805 [Anaerolineales bacterium]|nr:hypothetical protein [Anaerolineales bacterium]
MDAEGAPNLADALAHIRKRQPAKALPLLLAALREDPQNATAWFLLSHVLREPHRQQFALIKALEADPSFARARERLEKLGGRAPERSAFVEGGPEEADTPQEASKAVDALMGEADAFSEGVEELRASVSPFVEDPVEEAEEAEKPRRRGPRLLLAVLLLGLLAVALVLGWQFAGGLDLFGPGASPTPVASRTLVPTWTPTPEGSAQGEAATPQPAIQPQFENSLELEARAGQLAAAGGE